jgi:basic membrane lipoprotein Med (substrate-binding protein (PBP1-ABC) superfamily)
MKKMKVSVLAFASAALLLFAGCSARTAATADEFQKQAKKAGYTVTEETASDSSITKALSAAKSDSGTTFEFITFDSDQSAQSDYISRKEELSSSGKTVIDSDNYNKYTLTNGELYYVLVRLGDTVLDCQTTTSSQKEAENFISSLKY